MKHKKLLWILVGACSAIIVFSCSISKQKNVKQNTGAVSYPSPPAIVYKTRADYYQNVPVTLSDDKKRVISYPAQSDIRRNGEFVYPTQLKNGYLLDNRGIGLNTAFLRFTYEDYFNMDNIPTAEGLMNYIIDDSPFTEFYELGKRADYKDIKKELNDLIDKNELNKH